MIFFFSIFGVGRILRPDQEHKEVISAPEGRPAGSRAGSSSLPADGSAEERRGFLRGRGETPETSGQTLRSGTRPSRIRSRCEKFQTFLTDVIFFFFPPLLIPREFMKAFHTNKHAHVQTQSFASLSPSLSLVTQLHSSITRRVSQRTVHFLHVFKTRHNSQQMVPKTQHHHQLHFVLAYRTILSVQRYIFFFFLFFLFLFAPLSECHKLELLAKAPSHRRIVGNNCPRCECATLFSPLTSAGKRF